MAPEAHRLYLVELCSGERRRWRHLGADRRQLGWWRDEDTGMSFSEAGVMYAWHIVAPIDDEAVAAAPPPARKARAAACRADASNPPDDGALDPPGQPRD